MEYLPGRGDTMIRKGYETEVRGEYERELLLGPLKVI